MEKGKSNLLLFWKTIKLPLAMVLSYMALYIAFWLVEKLSGLLLR
ncbi:hypothetical protein [Enterococcus larvae]|nr:hypothetical protein [Enterococcus larvae]